MNLALIVFGATAPSLKEQLAEAGLPESEVDQLNADNGAINRLQSRGYLSTADTKAYRKSIVNRLKKLSLPK